MAAERRGKPQSPCAEPPPVPHHPTGTALLTPQTCCSGTSPGTTTPAPPSPVQTTATRHRPPQRPSRAIGEQPTRDKAPARMERTGSGSSRGKRSAVPVPRRPGHRAMVRSSRSRSPPSIFSGQRQLWLRRRQKPQPLLLPPPSRPIKSRLEPLEPPALAARSAGIRAGGGSIANELLGGQVWDGRRLPHSAVGTSRRVRGPWLGT